FFAVVRAGFSQKRKQLKNALGSGLDLPNDEATELLSTAGIDPMRRAETLSLEEWAALAQTYGASAAS
ncbi:MAG: 16S rRNA (adenine(1518)-N(6)/adenine(1519)-N(6))-dimethyltransferase RsmA, partial [Anaerolineae bacterium]|nr:16S rRNA (adenine(1518)-N(6)/adenine(1519)-N(6))-dimethyltransferase RsmA [Anaerolineae bacterium]